MVADGRLDHLEDVWRTVTRERIYTLRPSVFFAGLLPGWLTLLVLDRAGSVFDPRPLRELIASSLDLDRVRASPVRLVVTTTDLARRRERLFDNRTVSIDALMAATAVPGAFPPVEVDGELLVDGGLTGRAPILAALEAAHHLDRVVVLLSYAAHETGEPPTTLRRALEQSFEMTMVHQIRRDAELARLKYPGVDVQLVVPSASLSLRPLDFDPVGLARALDLGQRDGEACLARWRGDGPR
jgi:predicted acylesterase/phospholipase RssA